MMSLSPSELREISSGVRSVSSAINDISIGQEKNKEPGSDRSAAHTTSPTPEIVCLGETIHGPRLSISMDQDSKSPGGKGSPASCNPNTAGTIITNVSLNEAYEGLNRKLSQHMRG